MEIGLEPELKTEASFLQRLMERIDTDPEHTLLIHTKVLCPPTNHYFASYSCYLWTKEADV